MSSLLNNASLLLNPAGSIISYQEDKIYSVLPKNGTGDFTFSGGDGGTRVNQQGYIEVTPANLIINSETIGASPWILNDTVITANSTVAPNGTTTADTVANNGTNAMHRVYQGPFTGYGSPQTMSFSLYVKYNNHQYFSFGLTDDSVYRSQVVVDLTNGTITQNFVNTGGDTLTSAITNVGGGWYYITGTLTYATSLAGGNLYFLCTLQNQSTFSAGGYVGTGTSVFVWGAMFNTGGVKPYQPTTDRLNYPRITYQNGRGALLQEPQRTNLATYSEDLTNGVWSLNNVSITSNNITSPDGTQNADRVTRTSTANTFFYNTNTTTSSNRANSIFLKKGTIDQATILGNSYSSGTYATFNLSNGTIISSTGCTPFIEQYKDGWYRCGIIQTNGVSYVLIATLNGYNNDTVTSGEYLYAWGGQTEVVGTLYGDSKASSYIPTTSATVTRPLDRAYTGDTGNTSTSGVVYYDLIAVDPNSANGAYILIYNVSLNTSGVYLDSNSLGVVYNGDAIQVWNNSYSQLLDAFVPTLGQRVKLAIRYDGTNVVCFRDGIKKTVYSDTATGAKKYFVLKNGEQGYVNDNTLAYFPSALTDAQCQELTTVRSGSGGNISYYGPYTIHTFTGSATFTPSFNGEVEVLVVAGGGSGAELFGGGGAGGLIYASSIGVAQGTGYTITIGAGGASQSTYQNNGNNGSNSSAFGLVTIGGGGGGAQSVGLNGGSGGGGGDWAGIGYGGGVGTTGQGNNGGQGEPTGYDGSGGGGGGAGQAGQTGAVLQAGKGGDGLPYSISGFSTYYAGGGGGTCWQGSGTGVGTNGLGGLGGGGLGGNGTTNINSIGGPAVDYTGGGGGAAVRNGGTAYASGKGGNGIVIVRYLT